MPQKLEIPEVSIDQWAKGHLVGNFFLRHSPINLHFKS